MPPFACRRHLHTQEVKDVRNGSGSKGFVKIVEVGARDGLQNIPGPPVPTDIKAELVKRLHATGLRDIEVGSFVRPDRVPQMADTPALLKTLRQTFTDEKRPNYQVLVPNMKGLDNLIALEEQVKHAGLGRLTNEIALFVPASDGFCQANNGTTVDKLLASIPAVVEKALRHGYRVRGYVSVVIACPYDGKVSPEKVRRVTEVLDRIGCYEISLGDTTGQGSPETWRQLWKYLEQSGLDMGKVAAHDTFATSLASIASLLPYGLRIVDASVAGLGGCPYSPGATGNVATEDVVHLLHELGYSTGVDLDQLAQVGKWITQSIGRTNESRVGRAICARAAA